MSQSNDLGDDQNHEEDANNEFEFYFLFTKPLVLYLATEEGRCYGLIRSLLRVDSGVVL